MEYKSLSTAQKKQNEWHEQWTLFQDNERFLFEEWIAPATLNDFKGKSVLECGCGGGQHTSFVAPLAASIIAIDLNTTDIARERNRQLTNVRFVEADIATMDMQDQFDVVFCVGVIHHTDDPDRTFENIYRHCKPGGKLIIWTYSAEGNELVRWMVEPARKLIFRWMPHSVLVFTSKMIALSLYLAVYTVYLLPFMSFLPYYKYFQNFRKLSFNRNVLNVFDKLNAPQIKFTTLGKAHQWFTPSHFLGETISIRHYAGVSYSCVGVKK